MRIGIDGSSLIAHWVRRSGDVDHEAEAEADRFSSYWMAQLAVPDALTAIATMGGRTSTIEIGTTVIPTWPRHPLCRRRRRSTVQEAIGTRFTLGIGLLTSRAWRGR